MNYRFIEYTEADFINKNNREWKCNNMICKSIAINIKKLHDIVETDQKSNIL